MMITDLDKLCKPSQMYLFLAMIALIIVVYFNYDALNFTFCIGETCFNTPSKGVLLFINFLYILAWTFIIEVICKTQYKPLSWFLVFIPIILFILFVIVIFGPLRHKKLIFESVNLKINRNIADKKTDESKNKK
jgi:hypothetical protein